MPPSRDEYDNRLEKLAELLRRKPLTVRQISTSLGVCRPAVYQRLKDLADRGVKVFTMQSAPARPRPGPKSLTYGVR